MNWGTKLLFGMLAFMSFIIGMVVYMFRVHGRDALIEENYYEKGIRYNVEYDAKQNVITYNALPIIRLTKSQIIIQLTHQASYQVTLMRPSNSADDVKIKGNTVGKSNLILMDKSKLPKGLWFLNVQWRSENRNYLYTNNINL